MCSGLLVDFYWLDTSSEDATEHIEAAVTALFEAIRGAGTRLWSPFVIPLVKGNFRKRLQKAARGELDPPEELKPLRDGRYPLFEIRWSDIGVHEAATDDSEERYFDVEVRLIHAEPAELGVCAVGLHAHEKVTDGTPADIRDAQDWEIDHAEALFLQGQPRSWGVTRRAWVPPVERSV